jgi:hypothetical protein
VTVLPVNVYVPIAENDSTLTTVTPKRLPQKTKNRYIPQSLTRLKEASSAKAAQSLFSNSKLRR